jgi:hypothetical protein
MPSNCWTNIQPGSIGRIALLGTNVPHSQQLSLTGRRQEQWIIIHFALPLIYKEMPNVRSH